MLPMNIACASFPGDRFDYSATYRDTKIMMSIQHEFRAVCCPSEVGSKDSDDGRWKLVVENRDVDGRDSLVATIVDVILDECKAELITDDQGNSSWGAPHESGHANTARI
jgi:hypothetical protein